MRHVKHFDQFSEIDFDQSDVLKSLFSRDFSLFYMYFLNIRLFVNFGILWSSIISIEATYVKSIVSILYKKNIMDFHPSSFFSSPSPSIRYVPGS